MAPSSVNACQITVGEGASADVKLFLEVLLPLALPNGKAASIRDTEWINADTNSDGYLTFHAVELWIQRLFGDSLEKAQGTFIYNKFLRIYMYAFHDCKGSKLDYLERQEFRLLVAYLCVYALAFETFELVSSSRRDDGEEDQIVGLSLAQWLAGCNHVVHHGFVYLAKASDPACTEEFLEHLFYLMDEKGVGMIQLTEWFKYLIEKEMQYHTTWGRLLSIGACDDYNPPRMNEETLAEKASSSDQEDHASSRDLRLADDNDRKDATQDKVQSAEFGATGNLHYQLHDECVEVLTQPDQGSQVNLYVLVEEDAGFETRQNCKSADRSLDGSAGVATEESFEISGGANERDANEETDKTNLVHMQETDSCQESASAEDFSNAQTQGATRNSVPLNVEKPNQDCFSSEGEIVASAIETGSVWPVKEKKEAVENANEANTGIFEVAESLHVMLADDTVENDVSEKDIGRAEILSSNAALDATNDQQEDAGIADKRMERESPVHVAEENADEPKGLSVIGTVSFEREKETKAEEEEEEGKVEGEGDESNTGHVDTVNDADIQYEENEDDEKTDEMQETEFSSFNDTTDGTNDQHDEKADNSQSNSGDIVADSHVSIKEETGSVYLTSANETVRVTASREGTEEEEAGSKSGQAESAVHSARSEPPTPSSETVTPEDKEEADELNIGQAKEGPSDDGNVERESVEVDFSQDEKNESTVGLGQGGASDDILSIKLGEDNLNGTDILETTEFLPIEKKVEGDGQESSGASNKRDETDDVPSPAIEQPSETGKSRNKRGEKVEVPSLVMEQTSQADPSKNKRGEKEEPLVTVQIKETSKGKKKKFRHALKEFFLQIPRTLKRP